MALAASLAALAGCSHPKPKVVAVAPPVGHVYQVTVQVPPPTSRHVHLTAAQQEKVQQAFNVIALRSALMVAALSCNQRDQYDQFMTTFQPHVLDEQHVMDAYFKRIGGAYGRAKEDAFVTLLANNQSVNGIAQGSMFCLNNSAEYKAVLALKTPSDLDRFVTDQPPAQADVTTVAAVAPEVAPTVHKLHVRKARRARAAHRAAKLEVSEASSGNAY